MRVLVLAAAACLGGAVSAAHAQAPPASAFGRAPQVQQAAISPDGQHVAILGGAPAARTLAIATIDQPGLPAMPLGDVETVSVTWAGDYVLARVAFPFTPKGQPNLRYRFERNVAINKDATPASRLLDNDSASEYVTSQPVLGVVHGPPPRALVLGLVVVSTANAAMDTRIARKGADSQRPFLSALWSVDPKTGNGTLVERGDFDTQYWDVDLAGQARVRHATNELTQVSSLFGRAKGATTWSLIFTGAEHEANTYLGYSDVHDAILLSRVEGGQRKVVRRSLKDGATETLWSGDATSGPAVIWDTVRGDAAAIVNRSGDKSATQWLDAELGALQASLSRALKSSELELSDWSVDRNRFVVRASPGDGPASWYLFDRARKELSPLGDEYPELAGVKLGTTRLMSYKARDGLEIPAYLTLPPGLPAGARPPLVVLPHGGPAAHDGPDFDYLTQFLATRGYAVLRPQFRGSTGFGVALTDAGQGEWGGKMQTDLLDGVARLGADGVIDPSRVCIVGASFGGYAALAGVTLNPGTYRCAASINGVAELGRLIGESSRLYGADNLGLADLKRRLGGMSLEALAAISPVTQAGRADAPILLIHAADDTIVPAEHSRRMQAALAAAGKPVELVMLPNEGHYLMRSATRTQMLQSLETFLATNLPVAR